MHRLRCSPQDEAGRGMTPLDLLAWSGAIIGVIVAAAIAIAVIVGLLRSIRNPRPVRRVNAQQIFGSDK